MTWPNPKGKSVCHAPPDQNPKTPRPGADRRPPHHLGRRKYRVLGLGRSAALHPGRRPDYGVYVLCGLEMRSMPVMRCLAGSIKSFPPSLCSHRPSFSRQACGSARPSDRSVVRWAGRVRIAVQRDERGSHRALFSRVEIRSVKIFATFWCAGAPTKRWWMSRW